MNEYCTVKQIRSLFSRWSQQVRTITLAELRDNIVSNNLNPTITDASSLAKITSDICDLVSTGYGQGDWVIVIFNKQWYPGEVSIVEENDVQVKCMKRIGEDENKFTWPDKDDIGWYSKEGIMCLVEPPVPVTKRAFALSICDINKIKQLSSF